ncbi:hypothetical protein DERF_001545 [Dermatophagoides farinae]|uniref:Uncharacterized protein n=1 Tax=Dermatophagoides farinae TaxID=6954 RepID=A0A922IAP3_DERFA|nr:hypothetical protein DERF_005993 [Dermatophagoides farinae]KAH9527536.1 hypothetical protein DERF_001545 [Dermatophagoides farinae]
MNFGYPTSWNTDFKARAAAIGVKSSRIPIRRQRVDKHATIKPQYFLLFRNVNGPKPSIAIRLKGP